MYVSHSKVRKLKKIRNNMKNNTNINFALFIINFNSFWGAFKLCLLSIFMYSVFYILVVYSDLVF